MLLHFDECSCFTLVNELASLPIFTSVYVKKTNKDGPIIPVPGEMQVRGWQDQGQEDNLLRACLSIKIERGLVSYLSVGMQTWFSN